MSWELLQSIEQAEARAEDIRQDAAAKAREMLKSVEAVCVQHEREAAVSQRSLSQGILEDAQAATDKRIAQAAAQDAEARDAVAAAARQRLDAAAQRIFERVVTGDGAVTGGGQ